MSGHEDTIELPASTSAGPRYSSPRLFGREKSVGDLLGGGKCADVLLWKKKPHSAAVLGVSTLVYVLFELCGYTLLSVVCNALLFLTIGLFLWSNAAAFLNRSGPVIPELRISEEQVHHVAREVQAQLNYAYTHLRGILLGRDWLSFLKVSVALWIVSTVGSWCDLLTLLYIVIVLAHVVPVVYDKYEDHIEHYVKVVVEEGKKQYKKVDEIVMKKIPRAVKEKKAE